jgi:hypothetical protein
MSHPDFTPEAVACRQAEALIAGLRLYAERNSPLAFCSNGMGRLVTWATGRGSSESENSVANVGGNRGKIPGRCCFSAIPRWGGFVIRSCHEQIT